MPRYRVEYVVECIEDHEDVCFIDAKDKIEAIKQARDHAESLALGYVNDFDILSLRKVKPLKRVRKGVDKK